MEEQGPAPVGRVAMPTVRLPDGDTLEVADGACVADVAKRIGSRLAQAAVAARLDGKLVDLSAPVPADGTPAVEILTDKSDEALSLLRHSTAHVMAAAVRRLYGEGVKFGIGPAIEDGFYYDFDVPGGLTEDELPRIEAEMAALVAEKVPFERREVPVDVARRRLEAEGQTFKVELLHDIQEAGPAEGEELEEAEAKPEPDGTVTLYETAGFTDLCRGPHLPDTGKVGAFKLLSVAGSYWRGDERRPMLQRIYGTAFFSKKDLEAYLARLEEAKKRDHRRIGKDLDLFSFHEEGPGFAFVHHAGMVVLNEILEYWRRLHWDAGYQEIRTPTILSESLWHRSGHWDNYREAMYFTDVDGDAFAVKPMNCPGGLLVYLNTKHSYREFPMRVAELGLVHRHEASGVMHGLFRVRQFTQDDAHIFCTPDQIEAEIIGVIELTFEIYQAFGFEDFHIELSTKPEKHIGSDEIWETATNALEDALKQKKIEYKINEGDGAFYGPKIDFHIRDCLKRSWQLGTIQLDFSMPERFGLEYTDKDNIEKTPVMIHRAVLGSFERFIGILIEHYGANFPLWLSPEQVRILPISEKSNDYAAQVERKLKDSHLRCSIDSSDEKIGAKIAKAHAEKLPYMLVVGPKEAQAGTVNVRIQGIKENKTIQIDEFLAIAERKIAEKKIDLVL